MNILLHRLQAVNFKQLADVTLHFPPQGTILIEGANEAGKSSLFEAVYFALYGQGLGTGQLADLRRYEADEMRVELDFSIDGRPFTIARKFVGSHRATLEYQDAQGERLSSNSVVAIRRQLQEELRLSAEALLNTCFVEQKRLERLEDLNPAQRRAAINELLNLRALTDLAAEFKVTREDEFRLSGVRERVQIAYMDAEMPALEAAEQVAWRCLWYTQARRFHAEAERLCAAMQQAREGQKKIRLRREEIAGLLAEYERLSSLLRAVSDNLCLLMRAWTKAQSELEEIERKLEALRILADGLPARREQLRAWEDLCERLKELETLENEARELQATIETKRQELAELDDLLQWWEQGERQRQELEAKRALCREKTAEAEARHQERQAAIRRDSRLALLLQHGENYERAHREAQELATQIAAATEAAERMPTLQSRMHELEVAEVRVRRRAEAQREAERNQTEIEDAARRQEEQAQRQARIEALEKEQSEQESRVAEYAQEEQTRRTVLQQAQEREALMAWAEAASRQAEGDPASERLAQLDTQQQQARTRWEETGRQAASASRQALPGYALIGVGLLGGGVGFVAQMVMIGLGFGALLIGIGLWLTGRALRMRRMASQAQAEAKTELDALEGERRATAAQAQSLASRRQEWAAREQDGRRALENLGVPVPVSPAEAQTRLAALPQIPLAEAQKVYRAAETALYQEHHALEGVQQRLATERRLLEESQPESLAARLEALRAEQARLQEILAAEAGLSKVLEALGVDAEGAGLPKALQAAREQVASAVAVANRLPALRQQQAEKEAQAEDAQTLAAELELEGEALPDWTTAATQERADLAVEQASVPDVELQQAAAEAQESERAVERRLTALETEQKTRRERLDSVSREELRKALEAAEQEHAENARSQVGLQQVRSTLQGQELPQESGALYAHLAVIGDRLSADTAKAETLPDVEREKENYETALAERREEFCRAWGGLLTEPVPESLAAAQGRLPQIQAETEEALQGFDVERLHSENEELDREHQKLGREIATMQHEEGKARKQVQSLRSQLGVEEDIPLETLAAHCPELAEANQWDEAGWQQECERRREQLRNRRSERAIRAQQAGVAEERLDLETEKRALEEAGRSLAVKRRAGEIVERTRQSIISRVMPLTMQNMRQVLPLLTEGRYQDVEWDEENSAISVYDGRARAHLRKRVFSGGARDQISLALRLAFALATLPGEQCVRPGWLFLDEPLSSFDRVRTQALVDLLTRGLIRREFAQIFLVSHSESFDPNQFDYRLRMDGGCVVESNLPDAPFTHAVTAVPAASRVPA